MLKVVILPLALVRAGLSIAVTMTAPVEAGGGAADFGGG